MSERLEERRAREEVRGAIGWVVALVGLGGAVLVAAGVLYLFGLDAGRVRIADIDITGTAWAPALALAFGLALLACARGLWLVRPWARWASIALFASHLAQCLVALVLQRALSLPIFSAWVLVYLLKPSTARLFARSDPPAAR
ncbi:MAG: hypothetical protein EXS08_06920 [Planctomycetes bacterium]|nr:hypothetical protein [Planctomycetota bacterium]